MNTKIDTILNYFQINMYQGVFIVSLHLNIYTHLEHSLAK